MFADDTTVLVNRTDMQSVYDHMNVALKGFSDWYRAKQISANPTKTKYIHFGCHDIVVPAYLRLSMDGELLEHVPSVTILEDQHNTILHFITPFIIMFPVEVILNRPKERYPFYLGLTYTIRIT